MSSIIPEILFWISVLAIAHSYLVYPTIMILFAKTKVNNCMVYSDKEIMPKLAIIMAVRNAEKVVAHKIRSVFESGYNIDKISFYIGSDASTDNTDKLILEMLDLYPGIQFKRFEKRAGKVHIINELEKLSNSGILVFTDVHAFIEKGALANMAKHFLNPDIKVVGGRLKNAKSSLEGIVYQENVFLEQEFKLKYAEGKLLGTMIGAYGAFYAIRKNAFQKVPENYIADDFYISIKAIQYGGMAICEPEAVAFENVSGCMQSEFDRKARISVGNFQNLRALYSILFSKKIGLSFCFFSHKVLRWLGPIFIIIMIISSFFIWFKNIYYTIFFIIMMLSFIAPLIDYFTRKIQIHVIILRFITHFYYMNLALLIGLFKFMKGVKTNVWEPTNRE